MPFRKSPEGRESEPRNTAPQNTDVELPPSNTVIVDMEKLWSLGDQHNEQFSQTPITAVLPKGHNPDVLQPTPRTLRRRVDEVLHSLNDENLAQYAAGIERSVHESAVLQKLGKILNKIDHPVSRAVLLALTLSISGHEMEQGDEEDVIEALASGEEFDAVPADTDTQDAPMVDRSATAAEPTTTTRKRSAEKRETLMPLPVVELGRTVSGFNFVNSVRRAAKSRHLSPEQEYQYVRTAVLMWNKMVDEGRVDLLRRKYHAKSFRDPHVEKHLGGWLHSDVGKETVGLLREYCNGKDGNPGPEYIPHFLGLIMMESDGNPDLVQSGSGAVGLVQAMPKVAAHDAKVIDSPADRDKLKDPAVNIKYLIQLWWKMYHEEEHRRFGFGNDMAYNMGEGQFKSILQEMATNKNMLNIGHQPSDAVVRETMSRMTFVRLYKTLLDHKFHSITQGKEVSYADSAKYALGIGILSDYFAKRLGIYPPKKVHAANTAPTTPASKIPTRAIPSITRESQVPPQSPSRQLPHTRFRHRGK